MNTYLEMSANEIIPNLFLGDITSSKNRDFFDSVKIGMVVNCSKTIPFLEGKNFIKVRVPVDDNLQDREIDNLAKWGPSIVRKIWDEYRKGTTILVHCHAGMQRSAAVVAMFLMFYQRCTHREAMSRIKKRRPIVFEPGANFYKAILSFENKLNEALKRTMDNTYS
jgi:dual specificity phosphatase 12